MDYSASADRYSDMRYPRCGQSGLKLPLISLGLWHNFGGIDAYENGRHMVHRAFDLGITHFDLANNYGPPPGSAEKTFGRILQQDLQAYRDELIISSKAGYTMWPGPYGEWGSRKNLIASCDASLKRMGLDYVDIFYSHRPDPDTPLEETMSALDQLVRSGKALYVGISSYGPAQTQKVAQLLKQMGTPCLIHQPSYSMFNRWIEDGLLDVLDEEGMGCIIFSPLAQGLLTCKYLDGIPENSRAASSHGFLQVADITESKRARIKKLNALAKKRGQTMAQLALVWALRDPRVTSAVIGASKASHIEDAVAIQENQSLSESELSIIEGILTENVE